MRFLLALKSVALATFFLFSVEATAQDASCELTIEANDRMQFSALTMEAPASCTEITVMLTHTGQLPREGMGHNWVLTTSADFNDVANEGMKAGLANNYMPVGDARVIAGTEIIGWRRHCIGNVLYVWHDGRVESTLTFAAFQDTGG